MNELDITSSVSVNDGDKLTDVALTEASVAAEEKLGGGTETEGFPPFTSESASHLPGTEIANEMGKDLNTLMADKDPMEVFSMLFYTYYPRLEKHVNKMSNKQLRRFIKCIIGGELIDRHKTLTKEQLEAFAIGDRLMESRYFMIFGRYLDVQIENERKAQEQAAQASETNSVETLKPEDNVNLPLASN